MSLKSELQKAEKKQRKVRKKINAVKNVSRKINRVGKKITEGNIPMPHDIKAINDAVNRARGK